MRQPGAGDVLRNLGSAPAPGLDQHDRPHGRGENTPVGVGGNATQREIAKHGIDTLVVEPSELHGSARHMIEGEPIGKLCDLRWRQ